MNEFSLESLNFVAFSETKQTQDEVGKFFYNLASLLAGGYWGFHRGKPVPFANRAPSWIFEARAPGYARVAQKSREGEGEGREKPPARKPAPLE